MDEIYYDLSDQYDKNDYYHAWLLRGDNPNCYSKDGYVIDKTNIIKYDFFAKNYMSMIQNVPKKLLNYIMLIIIMRK